MILFNEFYSIVAPAPVLTHLILRSVLYVIVDTLVWNLSFQTQISFIVVFSQLHLKLSSFSPTPFSPYLPPPVVSVYRNKT